MVSMTNRQTKNNETVKRYVDRFSKYGVSKDTLGWFKGKQDLRYRALLQKIPPTIKTITDIGCGFGDGIEFIREKFPHVQVTGVDLVTEFIEKCRQKYPDCDFKIGDYVDVLTRTDAVIASGVFNHHTGTIYKDIDNLVQICKDLKVNYLAFDSLSNNVDFKTDTNHYSDPAEIIRIINKYSRRYFISHLEQPFEFTAFIDFNDQFDKNSSRYLDITGQ